MSPITRPPPLPSIPRPCTATQAAITTTTNKASDDNTTAVATNHANARQSDGGGGRGTSRTPARASKPASVAEPTVLAVGRAFRENGSRSIPEANAGRNHSEASLPLPVDENATAAAGELLREENLAAEETMASMTSVMPEPDAVKTTPRDVSREHTPAAATTEANASVILGSLGVVPVRASSTGPVVSSFALSTRAGDDDGAAGSSSSNFVEYGQVGTTTGAPAGSLVRLKRRRQQARTRSNSQR